MQACGKDSLFLSFKRKSSYKLIISIITIWAFLFNIIGGEVAWAFNPTGSVLPASGTGAQGSSGHFSSLDELENFKVPTSLGQVKNIHQGSNKKTIIHIQDAHCNYSAQKSIKGILEYLNQNYGVNLIGLEGGAGDYDLSIFTKIEDLELREKVADYFTKEGRINGAELFAILNPSNIELKGLESPKLYSDNLNAFKENQKHQDEIDTILRILSFYLSKHKENIYSKELKELDARSKAYHSQELDFKEYLTYLYETKANHKLVLSNPFKNLSQLIEITREESGIDFRSCDSEKEDLIRDIKKVASKLELENLVKRAFDFKSGLIKADKFYLYLLEKGKSCYVNTEKYYPNLIKYSKFLKKYETLDKYKVFEELQDLEEALFIALSDSDTQRELYNTSKDLDILKKLFSASLSRKEFDYYKKNKQNFKVARFISFMGIKQGNLKLLDAYRTSFERFYTVSFKRDNVFIKNLKRYMKDKDTAVLFTGGFHTESLKELLKKQGYSYIVILPKFDPTEKTPYFKLLSGGLSPIEEAVKESISGIAVASPLNHLRTSAIDKQVFSLAVDRVTNALQKGEEPVIIRTLPSEEKAAPTGEVGPVRTSTVEQKNNAETGENNKAFSISDRIRNFTGDSWLNVFICVVIFTPLVNMFFLRFIPYARYFEGLLVAPFLEELAFRKIYFRNILIKCDKESINKSIFVSSIIFLIFHASKIAEVNDFLLYYIFDIFITGIILASVYVRGKKLLYPIITHFIINLLMYVSGLMNNLSAVSITIYLVLEVTACVLLFPRARHAKKFIESIQQPTATPLPVSKPGRADRTSPVEDDLIQILTQLAYPQEKISLLVGEFRKLFASIDFSTLKKEIASAAKITERSLILPFIEQLYYLLEQKGYLNNKQPLPLIKLLLPTLNNQDIFKLIAESTLSAATRELLNEDLVSCAAVSQLGYILLTLFGFSVKGTIAREHAFLLLPLSGGIYLGVDFMLRINIDIKKHYRKKGKYLVLRHKVDAERLRTLQGQFDSGTLNIGELTVEERLSFFYPYIQIGDSHGLTHSLYNNLGVTYTKLERYEDAVKACEEAIRLNPNHAEAYCNLGLAYAEMERYEDAIKAYKKAIKLNPNFAGAHCDLGATYAELKRHKNAIRAYKKAIKLNPNYAEAYYNLGLTYAEMKKYEDAIDTYKEAIKLDPNYAEAYCNLGLTYAELERCEDAITAYEKAIKLNPNLAEAYCNLGATYGRLQRYEDAVKACEEAIRLNPNHAEAYCNLGLAYAEMERYEDAIKAYKKAIKLNPNFANAYCNLGVTYAELERYEDAIDAYKQAIKLNPNYAGAHFNLGGSYRKMKRYKDAAKAYEKAITLNPNFAYAYCNLGVTYAKLQRYKDAVRVYKKAIKLNPNFTEAYYNLAVNYTRLRKHAKAITSWAKVVNIQADLISAVPMGYRRQVESIMASSLPGYGSTDSTAGEDQTDRTSPMEEQEAKQAPTANKKKINTLISIIKYIITVAPLFLVPYASYIMPHARVAIYLGLAAIVVTYIFAIALSSNSRHKHVSIYLWVARFISLAIAVGAIKGAIYDELIWKAKWQEGQKVWREYIAWARGMGYEVGIPILEELSKKTFLDTETVTSAGGEYNHFSKTVHAYGGVYSTVLHEGAHGLMAFLPSHKKKEFEKLATPANQENIVLHIRKYARDHLAGFSQKGLEEFTKMASRETVAEYIAAAIIELERINLKVQAGEIKPEEAEKDIAFYIHSFKKFKTHFRPRREGKIISIPRAQPSWELRIWTVDTFFNKIPVPFSKEGNLKAIYYKHYPNARSIPYILDGLARTSPVEVGKEKKDEATFMLSRRQILATGAKTSLGLTLFGSLAAFVNGCKKKEAPPEKPAKAKAPVSAKPTDLYEDIKQQMRSLGYSENIAEDFTKMVGSWKDQQRKPLLDGLKLELYRQREACEQGKITKTQLASDEVKLIERLYQSIKVNIECVLHTFELNDVTRSKQANCLGYTQLFYALGNAIGFKSGAVNVKTYYISGLASLFSEDGIHIVNSFTLTDGRQVMADLGGTLSGEKFISKPFVLRKDFTKSGIYWELKTEDNPLLVHRKIQLLDISGIRALMHSNRGNRYTKMGEYKEALAEYDKAIDLNKYLAEVYFNRGITYRALGKAAQGIPDLTRVIELDPGFYKAYYDRGNAYYIKKDYDLAIRDYTKAVALSPKFAWGYCARAETYNLKKEPNKAIADLKIVIKLNPELPEAYLELGKSHAQLRQPDEAKKYLLKAVGLKLGLKKDAEEVSKRYKLNIEFNNSPKSTIRTSPMDNTEPHINTDDAYGRSLQHLLNGPSVTAESEERLRILSEVGPEIERYIQQLLENDDIRIAIIPAGSTLRGYAASHSDIEYSIVILRGIPQRIRDLAQSDETRDHVTSIFNECNRLINAKKNFGDLLIVSKMHNASGITHGDQDPSLLLYEREDDGTFIPIYFHLLFLPVAYGDALLVEQVRGNAIQFLVDGDSPEKVWEIIRHRYADFVTFSIPVLEKKSHKKLHLVEWLASQSVDVNLPKEVAGFLQAHLQQIGLPNFSEMQNIYSDRTSPVAEEILTTVETVNRQQELFSPIILMGALIAILAIFLLWRDWLHFFKYDFLNYLRKEAEWKRVRKSLIASYGSTGGKKIYRYLCRLAKPIAAQHLPNNFRNPHVIYYSQNARELVVTLHALNSNSTSTKDEMAASIIVALREICAVQDKLRANPSCLPHWTQIVSNFDYGYEDAYFTHLNHTYQEFISAILSRVKTAEEFKEALEALDQFLLERIIKGWEPDEYTIEDYHLDPTRIYSEDRCFLTAAHYFNRSVVERGASGYIKPLTWEKVVDLFSVFRADVANPFYTPEIRRQRIISLRQDKEANDILSMVNSNPDSHQQILETAAQIFSIISSFTGPNRDDYQKFLGDKKGFDSLLPMNDYGFDQLAPASGHHRLAWFMMNFMLIRNGYGPFYFPREAEFNSVEHKTSRGDQQAACKELISLMNQPGRLVKREDDRTSPIKGALEEGEWEIKVQSPEVDYYEVTYQGKHIAVIAEQHVKDRAKAALNTLLNEVKQDPSSWHLLIEKSVIQIPLLEDVKRIAGKVTILPASTDGYLKLMSLGRITLDEVLLTLAVRQLCTLGTLIARGVKFKYLPFTAASLSIEALFSGSQHMKVTGRTVEGMLRQALKSSELQDQTYRDVIRISNMALDESDRQQNEIVGKALQSEFPNILIRIGKAHILSLTQSGEIADKIRDLRIRTNIENQDVKNMVALQARWEAKPPGRGGRTSPMDESDRVMVKSKIVTFKRSGETILFDFPAFPKGEHVLHLVQLNEFSPTNPPRKQTAIPDLMTYSTPIDGDIQNPGLKGVLIIEGFRDKGLLRPLLNLFFTLFPSIRKVHPTVKDLLLLRVLVGEYGFAPEDDGIKPNVWVKGTKGKTIYKDDGKVLYVCFEDKVLESEFKLSMAGSMLLQYQFVDRKDDSFQPLYLGHQLIVKDGEKFDQAIQSIPIEIESRPSDKKLLNPVLRGNPQDLPKRDRNPRKGGVDFRTSPMVWTSRALEGVEPLKNVKQKVYAVGDIHAELDGFREILEGLELIRKGSDENGLEDEWLQEGVILIQEGDAIGRGDKPIETIAYLRYLHKIAGKKNSKVIRIIGNHELFRLLLHAEGLWPGQMERLIKGGEAFRDIEGLLDEGEELLELIREDIREGRLIAAHELGKKVFTHGIVTKRLLRYLSEVYTVDINDPTVFANTCNDILKTAVENNNFDNIIFSLGKGVISDRVKGITTFYFGNSTPGSIDRLPFDLVVAHDPSYFETNKRIGVIRGASGRSAINTDVGMSPHYCDGRGAVVFKNGIASEVFQKPFVDPNAETRIDMEPPDDEGNLDRTSPMWADVAARYAARAREIYIEQDPDFVSLIERSGHDFADVASYLLLQHSIYDVPHTISTVALYESIMEKFQGIAENAEVLLNETVFGFALKRLVDFAHVQLAAGSVQDEFVRLLGRYQAIIDTTQVEDVSKFNQDIPDHIDLVKIPFGFPVYELCSGTFPARYFRAIPSDRRFIFVDKNHFVIAYLKQAKEILEIGNNVEILEKDILELGGELRPESAGAFVLSNVGTYVDVSSLDSECYSQLGMLTVAEGQIIIVQPSSTQSENELIVDGFKQELLPLGWQVDENKHEVTAQDIITTTIFTKPSQQTQPGVAPDESGIRDFPQQGNQAFLPSIEPEYVQIFVEEFVNALISEKVDMSQSQASIMIQVMKCFRGLRASLEQDFWVQPYLMLEPNNAVLVFKNGPRTDRLGSDYLMYKFSLTKLRVDVLKAIIDSGEPSGLLIHSVVSPEERQHYIDRFEAETRLIIAIRSTNHSTHLDIATVLTTAEGYAELAKATLVNRDDIQNKQRAIDLLEQIEEVVPSITDIALKLNRLAQLHKKSKVLSFRGVDVNQIGLVDILGTLYVLKGEWDAFYPEFCKGNNLEDDEDFIALDTALSQLVPILQAEIDFAQQVVTESPEQMTVRHVMLASLLHVKPGLSDIDDGLSLDIDEEKPFQRPAGRLEISIEDIEELEKHVVVGSGRVLAFIVENALYAALRVSEGIGQPVKLAARVVEIEGEQGTQKYIDIVVSDNGMGIPRSNQSKLPDLDFSTTGGGVGWSFGARAIQHIGGKVIIDSLTASDADYYGARDRIGTDITIRWPIIERTSPMSKDLPEGMNPQSPLAMYIAGDYKLHKVQNTKNKEEILYIVHIQPGKESFEGLHGIFSSRGEIVGSFTVVSGKDFIKLKNIIIEPGNMGNGYAETAVGWLASQAAVVHSNRYPLQLYSVNNMAIIGLAQKVFKRGTVQILDKSKVGDGSTDPWVNLTDQSFDFYALHGPYLVQAEDRSTEYGSINLHKDGDTFSLDESSVPDNVRIEKDGFVVRAYDSETGDPLMVIARSQSFALRGVVDDRTSPMVDKKETRTSSSSPLSLLAKAIGTARYVDLLLKLHTEKAAHFVFDKAFFLVKRVMEWSLKDDRDKQISFARFYAKAVFFMQRTLLGSYLKESLCDGTIVFERAIFWTLFDKDDLIAHFVPGTLAQLRNSIAEFKEGKILQRLLRKGYQKVFAPIHTATLERVAKLFGFQEVDRDFYTKGLTVKYLGDSRRFYKDFLVGHFPLVYPSDMLPHSKLYYIDIDKFLSVHAATSPVSEPGQPGRTSPFEDDKEEIIDVAKWQDRYSDSGIHVDEYILEDGFDTSFGKKKVRVATFERSIGNFAKTCQGYRRAEFLRTQDGKRVVGRIHKVYLPVGEYQFHESHGKDNVILRRSYGHGDELYAKLQKEAEGLFEVVELRTYQDYRDAEKELGVTPNELLEVFDSHDDFAPIVVYDREGANVYHILEGGKAKEPKKKAIATKLGNVVTTLHDAGLVILESRVWHYTTNRSGQVLLRADCLDILKDESEASFDVSFADMMVDGAEPIPPDIIKRDEFSRLSEELAGFAVDTTGEFLSGYQDNRAARIRQIPIRALGIEVVEGIFIIPDDIITAMGTVREGIPKPPYLDLAMNVPPFTKPLGVREYRAFLKALLEINPILHGQLVALEGGGRNGFNQVYFYVGNILIPISAAIGHSTDRLEIYIAHEFFERELRKSMGSEESPPLKVVYEKLQTSKHKDFLAALEAFKSNATYDREIRGGLFWPEFWTWVAWSVSPEDDFSKSLSKTFGSDIWKQLGKSKVVTQAKADFERLKRESKTQAHTTVSMVKNVAKAKVRTSPIILAGTEIELIAEKGVLEISAEQITMIESAIKLIDRASEQYGAELRKYTKSIILDPDMPKAYGSVRPSEPGITRLPVKLPMSLDKLACVLVHENDHSRFLVEYPEDDCIIKESLHIQVSPIHPLYDGLIEFVAYLNNAIFCDSLSSALGPDEEIRRKIIDELKKKYLKEAGSRKVALENGLEFDRFTEHVQGLVRQKLDEFKSISVDRTSPLVLGYHPMSYFTHTATGINLVDLLYRSLQNMPHSDSYLLGVFGGAVWSGLPIEKCGDLDIELIAYDRKVNYGKFWEDFIGEVKKLASKESIEFREIEVPKIAFGEDFMRIPSIAFMIDEKEIRIDPGIKWYLNFDSHPLESLDISGCYYGSERLWSKISDFLTHTKGHNKDKLTKFLVRVIGFNYQTLLSDIESEYFVITQGGSRAISDEKVLKKLANVYWLFGDIAGRDKWLTRAEELVSGAGDSEQAGIYFKEVAKIAGSFRAKLRDDHKALLGQLNKAIAAKLEQFFAHLKSDNDPGDRTSPMIIEEPLTRETLTEKIELHRKTVASVVRPNGKKVHTIIITADEALVNEDKLVTQGVLEDLHHTSRKLFGPQNGNDVRVCRASEFKALIDDIEDSDWTNTFIYIDSRAIKNIPDSELENYITTTIIVDKDSSFLAAVPVSAYSAYSQVYATFIERVDVLYQVLDNNREEIQTNEEIIELSKSMAEIVESVTGMPINNNKILDLIPGLMQLSEGISIKQFINEYQDQHEWNLPPVEKINWDNLRRFLNLQARETESAA